MKILNNKNLKIFNIDPHKLRGNNFYRSIVTYREEIYKKLSKFILKDTKSLSCRLCKSRKKKKILSWKKKYQLFKCLNCELIYPNINISDKDYFLNKVYENKSYTKKFKREITSNFDYRKNNFGQERFNYTVKRLNINKKSNILDLGCGAGYYLKILKEKKYKYKGLEVANHLVRYCNEEHGLNVKNTALEYEKNNSYKLITMFDVIEHLYDPIQTFLELNKKLKNNGYCVAYTPNFHSIGYEIMREKQNTLLPFEHLCFFNDKSLNILSKKTGFKVEKIETFGFDIMDYLMMKEYEDQINFTKKLKEMISICQSAIDKLGLSNHFRITFKKIKPIE